MGKGSSPRPVNKQVFNDNFDAINWKGHEMPADNVPSKGIVGSLKVGTNFTAEDGQLYQVLDQSDAKGTLCLHRNTDTKSTFSKEKLVTPLTTLLYSSGV